MEDDWIIGGWDEQSEDGAGMAAYGTDRTFNIRFWGEYGEEQGLSLTDAIGLRNALDRWINEGGK